MPDRVSFLLFAPEGTTWKDDAIAALVGRATRFNGREFPIVAAERAFADAARVTIEYPTEAEEGRG